MVALVVTEKPAVAKDIAEVLGVKSRRQGFFQGEDYLITWAVGHLVGIAEPGEMDAKWQKWNFASLPMIPKQWVLKLNDNTKDQYKIVAELCNRSDVTSLICATDAGREGELIFRYILEMSGCNKPFKRLWISSLTKEAIRKGFDELQDGEKFDGLYESALARSRADWLVGMNLSRAYSMALGDVFSVGRVQTPTLSMIVARDEEIDHFKPDAYFELEAQFAGQAAQPKLSYNGLCLNPFPQSEVKDEDEKKSVEKTRLYCTPEQVRGLEQAIKGKAGVVSSCKENIAKLIPPLPFDLTELQRKANRAFGWTAKKTLTVAQALYESHKVITYPRTDSRYLSVSVAGELIAKAQKLARTFPDLLTPDMFKQPLKKPYVDDAKISDHHAIIPTGVQSSKLSQEQHQLYDVILRRTLAMWLPNYESATTTVTTEVTLPAEEAKPLSLVSPKVQFVSKGMKVLVEGWKALEAPDLVISSKAPKKDKKSKKADDVKDAGDNLLPKELVKGLAVNAQSTKLQDKKTKPPLPLSDARLLTAMESAGKELDDRKLSHAMKERGLGTPATRAAIIETLITRGYVERDKRYIRSTPKGKQLITRTHDEVKSAKLTGEWELQLSRIHTREHSFDDFMQGIEGFVQNQVDGLQKPGATDHSIGSHKNNRPPSFAIAEGEDVSARLQSCLREQFKFDSFRPYQEDVCIDLLQGKDCLVVMPTGAGKSLCYQVPGLLSSGVAIIVSPLIALMEDQIASLRQKGLRAACIHSGIDREEARQICRQYMNLQIDFLYVAPERLALKGFLNFLAKGRVGLIAVDEAHCISHWGHDFRSEYRMLGERLEVFENVPKLALTATATLRVQNDIVDQLRLRDPVRYICGFRRDNIGIHVEAVARKHRSERILTLLKDKKSRPAIVYTSTRKDAEELCQSLSSKLSCKFYHAGLPANMRKLVQKSFMEEKTDIVVATVAFGMGIDKANVRTVIHHGLPSSISSYYQEIGRAGRDGQLSTAYLLYSYEDENTRLFLHDMNYPALTQMRSLLKVIEKKVPCDPQTLAHLDFKPTPDAILQKLIVHGAVQSADDGTVSPTRAPWVDSYVAQKDYNWNQFKMISAFAANHRQCRMLQLLKHFGDEHDNDRVCGLCDICAKEDRPSLLPQKAAKSGSILDGIEGIVMKLLKPRGTRTVGSLYNAVKDQFPMDHTEFQAKLSSLQSYGKIELETKTFVKNGYKINYQQVNLIESQTQA